MCSHSLKWPRGASPKRPSWRTLSPALTKEHAERNCTPKTGERYRQLGAYVLPHIGATKLGDLSALALEPVLNRLKDSGGWNRKAKAACLLSAKTLRHIAGLLHVALETAIRSKLLKSNPVDGVQLPKLAKHEGKALDAAQLAKLC